MKEMIAIVGGLLVSHAAHGELLARDLDGDSNTIEAYYDDVLDVTWLADANYAQTSGHSVDGLMDWDEAVAWVGGLTLGGFTAWRLPDTTQPDGGCDTQSGNFSFGYHCNASEMGSLFYDTLSNGVGSLSNAGPFGNVIPDVYWSATEYVSATTNSWFFNFAGGYQYISLKSSLNYAWVVHSGDVGAEVSTSSDVPIASAPGWLVLAALSSLTAMRQLRR
ncbi:MAG: DUF1566 domain-containing protein [Myxococcota bacterium]